MITISLCSIAFRSEPIESLIPKIAEIGFDAVEVFGDHIEGRGDPELASIRELAAEHEVQILAMSPYLALTRGAAEYAESVERVKRFLHYGQVLGCRNIRTFTDVGPRGINSRSVTPALWEQGIRGLRQITALDRTFQFLLETHPFTLADTLDSTQRILGEVGAANLKVLYQPSTRAFAQAGMIECWRALKRDVVHLHLQNVQQGADGWVEEGELDLAGFLQALRAEGYAGSVSVEYCWNNIPWERVKSAYDFVARHAGAAR